MNVMEANTAESLQVNEPPENIPVQNAHFDFGEQYTSLMTYTFMDNIQTSSYNHKKCSKKSSHQLTTLCGSQICDLSKRK
jgi:hypothetical protein